MIEAMGAKITISADQDFSILDANDRCDSCGAQAYVMITMKETGFPLLFCAHHWTRHQDVAIHLVEDMVDETDKLNRR